MNEIKFDHFILTRFNVRITYESMDPGVHLGLDEAWLANRFELFERVCLPSVVRQTNKSFRWLVFLDVNTPERYRIRIDELSIKYPFLSPVYCEDGGEKSLIEGMDNLAEPDCLRIMTRLDNDDVIHPGMIENIQRMAKSKVKSCNTECGFFISFPMGYSESHGDYYIQRFRYNPFISFVSNADFGKSMFYWQHTKIAEVAPVFFNYTSPMWCQVIHDENVENTIRGIYWPWGRYSGLVAGDVDMATRSFAWQCTEFWRSIKKYILRS